MRFALPVSGHLPLIAASLAVASCGPPVLYDTDMRPVRSPIIVASVGNGWLAVDSTSAGVRAVLELQMEAPLESSQFVTLHTPTLHCSSKGEHRPSKVMREEPICRTAEAPSCSPSQRESGQCQAMLEQRSLTCLHVVRAEFTFERVPHLTESHYFTFAQTDTPIHWTRRP